MTIDWVDIAVRMQRRANVAALLGRHREQRNYCGRRDYAAKKAIDAGEKNVWKAISKEAGRIIA